MSLSTEMATDQIGSCPGSSSPQDSSREGHPVLQTWVIKRLQEMRAFTANPSISPEEDNSAGRVSIPDTMGAKAAGIGIPIYLLRS
jgi:hypothetical protein